MNRVISTYILKNIKSTTLENSQTYPPKLRARQVTLIEQRTLALKIIHLPKITRHLPRMRICISADRSFD